MNNARASSNGLMPTCFIVPSDRLVPIRKRVTTMPRRAIQTKVDVNASGSATYVLTIMASTKIKINHGMEIFPVRSRNINIVTKASGIIHSARVSLMRVAVWRATSPYTSPAPTTDDVSCIAIAAHVPNCACVISSIRPIGGKINNAIELRMKITPSDTAISFSLALSTGPTAAIALPPQMAVPDEIRYDVLRLMCIQ